MLNEMLGGGGQALGHDIQQDLYAAEQVMSGESTSMG